MYNNKYFICYCTVGWYDKRYFRMRRAKEMLRKFDATEVT